MVRNSTLELLTNCTTKYLLRVTTFLSLKENTSTSISFKLLYTIYTYHYY